MIWAEAVPDLVNAAISTARGNYSEAALHVVFAIPYANVLSRFGGKFSASTVLVFGMVGVVLLERQQKKRKPNQLTNFRDLV